MKSFLFRLAKDEAGVTAVEYALLAAAAAGVFAVAGSSFYTDLNTALTNVIPAATP